MAMYEVSFDTFADLRFALPDKPDTSATGGKAAIGGGAGRGGGGGGHVVGSGLEKCHRAGAEGRRRQPETRGGGGVQRGGGQRGREIGPEIALALWKGGGGGGRGGEGGGRVSRRECAVLCLRRIRCMWRRWPTWCRGRSCYRRCASLLPFCAIG